MEDNSHLRNCCKWFMLRIMKHSPPQRDQKKTMFIILVGSLLMVAMDFTFFGGYDALQRAINASRNKLVIDEHSLYSSETKDALFAALHLGDLPDVPEVPRSYPYTRAPVQDGMASLPDVSLKDQIKRNMPQKTVPYTGAKARVVIIIDDLGMGREKTYETIGLPGPLTLAFLPYAPQLPKVTGDARAKGHELLIHVPMEPVQRNLNPGPVALMEGMSKAEFDQNLDVIFKSFDGYVGINNHMGSKLTQDKEAMDWVMSALAERGLLFVDSKTISTSVAANEAAAYGLRFAERDVFLDHDESYEFVMQSLAHLEQVARRKGYAIAIGHPKVNTIRALSEWLPTLKDKNIQLVPVSQVVKQSNPVAVSKNLPVSEPIQPHEIEPSTY